jgi:hypothetical protein
MESGFEARYRRLARPHPARQLALRHSTPSAMQHHQIGDRHALRVPLLDFGIPGVGSPPRNGGRNVIT